MTRYLEQANECTDPVTGDYLWIYNASAGATDKDQKVDISRFAIKANTGTFTATQTFAPTSTSVNAATLNMPTSTTGYAVEVQYNSANRQYVQASATRNSYMINAFDNGTDIGASVGIGRNSNVSTPAAGFLYLSARTGTQYAVWADNTGVVRVGTTLPTNANDTSGSVIGSQSSWVELKEDITPWNDAQAALDAVLACKLFSYRFKGDEGRRQYHGIVITDEDRGVWFSENDGANQAPALNERNLFGHLIAAIQAQQAQIEELKAKVEALTHAN